MTHTPQHGGQLRALAARHGLDPANILDFSASINPEGPPASVLEALQTSLSKPETLTLYPDLELHALRQALATHLAVPPDSLALSNGFVPLLEATVRTRRLRRTLLPVPAFNEYRRTLQLCGVEPIPFTLPPDFTYEPEALLQAIAQTNADSILLANPQNPSGHLTPAASLSPLLDHPNLVILLDEAFIDYTPEQSLTTHAPQIPNLVIFRSVTKFFSMPGLRVAYAVAHPTHTALTNAALPPWPISTLAADATIAALADEPYQHQGRLLNLNRRTMLTQSLTSLGLHVYPAAANFLLLRFPMADATPLWQTLLRDRGILLRLCSNFESLPPNHLRTAIRTEPENAQLVAAFTQTLSR